MFQASPCCPTGPLRSDSLAVHRTANGPRPEISLRCPGPMERPPGHLAPGASASSSAPTTEDSLIC